MKAICSIHSDSGLLTHYLEHYRKIGVTEFIFGVWGGKKNLLWDRLSCIEDGSITLIKSYDEQLSEIGEVAFWNRAREKFVKRYEWYVITDLDEFHVMPEYKNVYSLLEDVEAEKKRFVTNTLIDRTTNDGSIPIHLTSQSIWEQFPKSINITNKILGGCSHKVFMAKQNVPITAGHHWGTSVEDCFSKRGICYHFKWFGNLEEKETKKAIHYKNLGFNYYTENEKLLKLLKENNGKLFKE